MLPPLLSVLQQAVELGHLPDSMREAISFVVEAGEGSGLPGIIPPDFVAPSRYKINGQTILAIGLVRLSLKSSMRTKLGFCLINLWQLILEGCM